MYSIFTRGIRWHKPHSSKYFSPGDINLIFDVGLSKNKQPIRKYCKADYVAMRKWFNEKDWAQKCDELNVEEMWHTFSLLSDQAVNMFAPLVYNKSRKNPRWFNRVTKSARNYISRMWVRYRQSK